MRHCLHGLIFAFAAAALAPAAVAQKIYSCVDAKGRRLTSDRPILECNDREQQELSSSGTVVRKIGPSKSADEHAAEEEKARKAAEERARQVEEKKRARALLSRYPDLASHDKERAAQLATIDAVIATANRRVAELAAQRKMADPAKAKRQIEDIDHQLAAQQRFVAHQEGEKQRINVRFDEERARLQPQWEQQKAAEAFNAAH